MCQFRDACSLAKPASEGRWFAVNQQVEATEQPSGNDSERAIQPLREVGTMTKTQYWSFDDIEDAIREANLRGIDPQQLFGTAEGGAELAI